MTEQDPNQHVFTQVECPHCQQPFQVGVVKIWCSEAVDCPACSQSVDLTEFNTEELPTRERNQKEFDKLRRLLG